MEIDDDAPLAGRPLRPGSRRAEAARRLAERGPVEPPATSRSYSSIVRANVFTVFNLILAVFGGLTLAFGDWRDALFLGVLVANSTIGITQEVRAKRALDRLAALVAPTARVVRDGEAEHLGVADVVVGDLVRVESGDQLVADGRLEEASGLRVDESILTGESEPVARAVGEEVRSGSFAVEGAGAYVVDGGRGRELRRADRRRGPRFPASPLTARAGAEPAARDPRRRDGAARLLLGFALWRLDVSVDEAVPRSVAAVVSLVPEGLILLTSLTYAVAALRMARRGALVQQLNAIESLAAVDVVCLDKTGTLTEGSLRVVELVPAAGVDDEELAASLARFAAASPSRNTTLEAIAARSRGAGRGGGGPRPLRLAPRLERGRPGRDDLRPRRARALPARGARLPRGGRVESRPTRARLRDGAGARRPIRTRSTRRPAWRRSGSSSSPSSSAATPAPPWSSSAPRASS